MDWATIITAAVSAGTTLVVCLINNHYQISKTLALFELRMQQLQEKVDKHNNLVERTYRLEEASARQGDEIKRHNERLRELEDKRGDDLR